MRNLRFHIAIASGLALAACLDLQDAPPDAAPADPEHLTAARLGPEPPAPDPGDKDDLRSHARSTVTITGRVFYNDRRNDGLFADRETLSGAPGEPCGTDGVRADGSDCSLNYLGGEKMVVEIIERDIGFVLPFDWNCKAEDLLGAVSVRSDGTFTATVSADDPCNNDDWSATRIALRVRLRYCGVDGWCASVGSDWNDEYALYHPGGSHAAPLAVSPGSAYDVGTMIFTPAGGDPAVANDHQIAANYYASVVDTMKRVHVEEGIPFFEDEYGEVQFLYPSTQTDNASTLGASKVVIADRDDWIKGEVIAHEYGHVLMVRAWDGDSGGDGIDSSWNAYSPQHRHIAFSEGWANFVSRVVFDQTRPCDKARFDDNATKPLRGPLGQGSRWVTNVNKLLCDWHDTRVDDDGALAGGGDYFSASFHSIWSNLRNMYLERNAYGGDHRDGLWICDYVDYYLDVRKSPLFVGTQTHLDYVEWITDLIYNNNIACFRPAPAGF